MLGLILYLVVYNESQNIFYYISLLLFIFFNCCSITNTNVFFRWFIKLDWIMLYNKNMVAPFIPTYNSPSDTHNFEVYVEEDATVVCAGVDQTYFDDF